MKENSKFFQIKLLLAFFLLIHLFQPLFAQRKTGIYKVDGWVREIAGGKPIDLATVSIPEINIWGVTNQRGEFSLSGIPAGTYRIQCQLLGYKDTVFVCNINKDIKDLQILLSYNTLALNEVVVTAQASPKNIATTYNIGQDALLHQQIINVTDISSLLPGGQTNTQNTLLNASRFVLRSGSGVGLDNPTFGTGVEVDGVRLSNNASNNSTTYGIDTRNIATSNIESVEVITGIPSVEYGDISNGVVKINTRKGKSPATVVFATNINTKQISLDKGIGLGDKKGVLNFNIEHTKSISDIASPYTSYQRNALSVMYNNTLNQKNGQPLRISAGVTGNIGGYNSKHDPDAFRETYTKQKDNTLRANIALDWLLNKPWITNFGFWASGVYSDKRYEQKANKSSSTSTTAIHGKNEGYFVATPFDVNPNAHIVIIPRGYWYETMFEDDKPVDVNFHLKYGLSKKTGKLHNTIKAGIQYALSRNLGQGYYYADLSLAPTWREYRYNNVPPMRNVALYAEDRLIIPINKHKVQLLGGLRADLTSISQSSYGVVSSISPRFNVQFQSKYDADKLLKQFSVHAGWGQMAKLPSFNILHPTPSYLDELTFAPGTTADGTTFYAYYTQPSTQLHNPELKWKKNKQMEVGLKATLGTTKISLSAYYNRTQNPYALKTVFTPFEYKFTGQSALESCPIPSADRIYLVNQKTGIVTVTDKTGNNADFPLAYRTRNRFKGSSMYENGTPVHRMGIEWIVDFGKIDALKTAIRFDGNYYRYKGVDERMVASTVGGLMADGNYFKYIGYYRGGTVSYNGNLKQNCNANLTITTHIPVIRLIVSLRVESSLYSFSQNLSEYAGRQRGFVLDSKDDYFPSETKTDIYAGDQFTGLYPDYYVTINDLETKIPFAEKLSWAKENDTDLFNELARLVQKSNYKFIFNPSILSAYHSANINITKEIGDKVSVSFYAKNFLNNMAKIKNSQHNRELTLYNSGYIPAFYYGLTLRLKI